MSLSLLTRLGDSAWFTKGYIPGEFSGPGTLILQGYGSPQKIILQGYGEGVTDFVYAGAGGFEFGSVAAHTAAMTVQGRGGFADGGTGTGGQSLSATGGTRTSGASPVVFVTSAQPIGGLRVGGVATATYTTPIEMLPFYASPWMASVAAEMDPRLATVVGVQFPRLATTKPKGQ